MAEGKLKPAAENPWYVLATIHGEQYGVEIDRELAEKNRRVWNAWSCQKLSEERCAELVDAMAVEVGMDVEVSELRAWPKIEQDVTARFKKRLGSATKLPDVREIVDFRRTYFPNAVVLVKSVFTQDASFDGANFSQRSWFSGASFMQSVGFAGAKFTRGAWFSGATFEGRSYFVDSRFEGEWQEGGKFEPAYACFDECEFRGPATFRASIFADFYPDWTGANLPRDIKFTAEQETTVETAMETEGRKKTVTKKSCHWPVDAKIEDPKAARDSCAIMRHALNQQGLPEAEHFFFRKEMRFAGKIGPWWQRFPYWWFDALSGYGNSLWYPTKLLLILVAAGTILNEGYFGSQDFAATEQTVENRWIAATGLSKSSTVPGFAFGRTYYDRDFLTRLDWPIKKFAGFQAIFGVILLFFLGLGLRTRFRLR